MLKAIHAQEDLTSAGEKAEAVIIKLKEMKLPEAAVKIEKEGIVETLTYMHFPREHRVVPHAVLPPFQQLAQQLDRRRRWYADQPGLSSYGFLAGSIWPS